MLLPLKTYTFSGLTPMTESAQQRLEHSLKILDVGPQSQWDDVERQYRQLIQRWHPDRNSGDDAALAQNKFIEINTAYKCVREHYRKTGSVPRPIPPEQQDSLLGTKKSTPLVRSVFKNKLAMLGAVALTILVFSGGILWALDSRLAENNRDRATAQKQIENEAAATQPSELTSNVKQNVNIKQLATGEEP